MGTRYRISSTNNAVKSQVTVIQRRTYAEQWFCSPGPALYRKGPHHGADPGGSPGYQGTEPIMPVKGTDELLNGQRGKMRDQVTAGH